MVSKLTEVGSIRLGTENYRLVRTEERREWRQTFEDEPPWQDGLPPLLSEAQETWHLGGLKSREGIPGSSEYGQNTDARFPFRLLPGPKVNVVPLPKSLSTPTSIFYALGYIWVVSGGRVQRIDPTNDSVVFAIDFGTGVTGIMGLKWETDAGLITTDQVSKSLWRVTVGAFSTAFSPAFTSGGIGWQQSATVYAYRLASGINRLFKVSKTGELKNLLSGKDPMVEANWSDSVQMGGKDKPPTGLVAYERSAVAAKPEGLFAVDIDGFGVPLFTGTGGGPNDGLGTAVIDPYVWYPHSRGLIQFVPGMIESIGLERETLNESPVRGEWRAFQRDGKWVYGALKVGFDTYIMEARDRGNDPGLGPWTWDTWVYLQSDLPFVNLDCQAMQIVTHQGSTRLWFGRGNDVAYVKLASGGGAPDVDSASYEFALSGLRYSTKFRYGDWGHKDFPKIVVVGKNLGANTYWDIYYSVDGGAFSNLDVGGAAMRVNSNVRRTFFLPSSAVGREVQYRFDYTSTMATPGGSLVLVEGFASPQSRKIPKHVVQLYLARGIHHDQSLDPRSAIEQFNDLMALVEQASAIAASGPWGEAQNMWVRSIQLVEARQEADREPELLVEATLQRREES